MRKCMWKIKTRNETAWDKHPINSKALKGQIEIKFSSKVPNNPVSPSNKYRSSQKPHVSLLKSPFFVAVSSCILVLSSLDVRKVLDETEGIASSCLPILECLVRAYSSSARIHLAQQAADQQAGSLHNDTVTPQPGHYTTQEMVTNL